MYFIEPKLICDELFKKHLATVLLQRVPAEINVIKEEAQVTIPKTEWEESEQVFTVHIIISLASIELSDFFTKLQNCLRYDLILFKLLLYHFI